MADNNHAPHWLTTLMLHSGAHVIGAIAATVLGAAIAAMLAAWISSYPITKGNELVAPGNICRPTIILTKI